MPRNPAPTKKKKPKPAEEYPVVDVDTTGPNPAGVLGKVVELPNPIEEEPPAPPVQVIERRIETVTVEIPLGEPPTLPRSVHVDLPLHGEHAHAFARLRQALRDKGAKAGNGRQSGKVKEVDMVPDVIRWLMDQISSC